MSVLIHYPTPADGLSAYQIWLNQGNTGTEQDFLDSLQGASGPAGQNGYNGTNGQSAYQIWLAQGHVGSEQDFLNWLKADVGALGVPQVWTMGMGTSAVMNVSSGNGSYVKIGGLVTVSGSFTPTQVNGRIRLPFKSKYPIVGIPLCMGAVNGVIVNGTVSANTDLLTFVYTGSGGLLSPTTIHFSYLVNYFNVPLAGGGTVTLE